MTASNPISGEERPSGGRGRRPVFITAGVLLAAILLVAALWMMDFGLWARRRPQNDGPRHALPAAGTKGGMPLNEALARRRSAREFAAKPLSPEQVSQLCWAAQGITDESAGFRTAPSAGGLYPLTVFVVDATGVREYHPREHALREVVSGDLRAGLQHAAHDQSCVGSAPVTLVIAMDVGRTRGKYFLRAERYCLLEAGHVAQNVLLQATALGLGGVPVGAFSDDGVSEVLRLPGHLRPIYLIPIGHPAGG